MAKQLIAIVVLLAGGMLVAFHFLDRPLLFVSKRGVVAATASAKSDAKSDGKTDEPKSGTRKKAEGVRVPNKPAALTASPDSPAPKLTAAECCPKRELPFPKPEDFVKGWSTAEIRARFGEPTFDIAGTRDGQVLERYYYVNREHTRLTVVDAQNGFLTSASSLQSPYFQLPAVNRDGGR